MNAHKNIKRLDCTGFCNLRPEDHSPDAVQDAEVRVLVCPLCGLRHIRLREKVVN